MATTSWRRRPGCLALALAVLLPLGPAAPGLVAQAPPHLLSSLGFLPRAESLTVVERSDFRRVVDGVSAGYVYRESRGSLAATSGGSYEGDLLILEETYQGGTVSARKVERSAALALGPQGQSPAGVDRGFPTHRGLLAGAPADLLPGVSWIAEATVALDPQGKGAFVLLPVLVEYRVVGPTTYQESPATALKAKFALRYTRPGGALDLSSIQGSHDLDLVVDPTDGSLRFVRDRFDEAYTFSTAKPERRTGFLLVFYKGATRGDRAGEVALLQGEAGGDPQGPAQASPFAPSPPDPSLSVAGPGNFSSPGDSLLDEGSLLGPASALAQAGVDLLDGDAGLVLRVKDLRFVADQAEILPEERWRLDALAAALARLPGRTFLVEGHAAGVGKPAGELELSERRARRVVEELAARGIPPGRFVYRGLGSSRPLTPNDTEAGRARNRRVEITILE